MRLKNLSVDMSVNNRGRIVRAKVIEKDDVLYAVIDSKLYKIRNDSYRTNILYSRAANTRHDLNTKKTVNNLFVNKKIGMFWTKFKINRINKIEKILIKNYEKA
jgi:ectoine hydroxylase-related dioxygenase (phytanoyl-CoA dioxygenase family)